MATSDFPPDGYEVTGTDVTWADDFSITEGIGTISSVADAGGGDIRAQTGTAHGLVVGQYVRFQGFTNYDGEYAITTVSDTTHFDVTATYVATDTGTFYTNFCGADSIRFEDTQPTEDPTYKYDSLIEIEEGKPYRMTALVQVSSIASSDGLMAVGVHWYDADDSFLSTTNVLSGKLDASGQWQRVTGIVTAPIGAHNAVPFVLKYSQFGTYYAWLDDIAIEHMPIGFLAYRSSNQTGMAAAGAYIEFNAEDYDYGDNFDVSTYSFIAPSDGIYTFNAQAELVDLDSDEYAFLDLLHSDDNWSSFNTIAQGQHFFSRQNDWPAVVTISHTALLSRGDQIRVVLAHGHATDAAVTGAADAFHSTSFSGFRVE
jgi:hypothetical protein